MSEIERAAVSSRLTPILGAVLLVAAIVVAYYPAVHAGFVWDDDAHLTANPHIVGPLGLAGIWTSSAAVYYPLVLTSFWLQYQLWGLDPLPYHLVNILTHAACAILLWRVLKTFGVRGAWLASAVWALHPVQVESVAWITELKNTQSCFFYLLAVQFFIQWLGVEQPTKNPGWKWTYLLALLCALLAILSKTSTVMLPVVLGLCWWWRDGRWRWKYALWLAPFFLSSGAAAIWTIWEQKYHSLAVGTEWMQTWPERSLVAGKIVWFYLGKLYWPHPLIFIYPRWNIDAGSPLSYLPLIGVVLALILLWRKREGWLKPVFLAFAYFVVVLFPVSGLFDLYFFRFSFVGDHFQYLAGIGPLVLTAAGISEVLDRFNVERRVVVPALSAILLIGLGIMTSRQSVVYTNALTLWRDTIAKNPNAWLAHANLGVELDLQSRFGEAVTEYQTALRINPNAEDAHNNLATDLAQEGHIDEAIHHLEEAVRIDPNHAQAHNNLGSALAQVGRTPEAFEHWRRALRIRPDFANAHYNLATALAQNGDLDAAIEHYRQALRLRPDDSDARDGLAQALQKRR
jgi:tetratricopeptide (TPR) repeat protein